MFDALRKQLEERLNKLQAQVDSLELPTHVHSATIGKVEAYREVLDLLVVLSPCERGECDYYQHYLAYGGPDLTHEGYHAAARKCEYWQLKSEEWFKNHPTGQLPRSIEQQCRYWEKQVRA